MQRSDKKLPSVGVPLRPGEGTEVAIQIDRSKLAAGISQSIALDLSTVPVPGRTYVADVCGVTQNSHVIRLFFAQCPLGTDDVHSLVVIHMSMAGIENMLGSIDQVSDPTYDEIMAAEKVAPEPPFVPSKLPVQTVTLSSNWAITAMSGQEAVIDFFKSSPFAVAALRRSAKLAVEPVLRIDLSSACFFGLVTELRRIVGTSKEG